jgi:hypothetical protein
MLQQFLERRVAVPRDGNEYKWDDATGHHRRKVESEGVTHPIAHDVAAISVMAAMTMADADVNLDTPNAHQAGVPAAPKVLARRPKR